MTAIAIGAPDPLAEALDRARRWIAHLATVVTTAGINWLTDLFDGTVTKPADYYVHWGTGAGTAAVGDTTLFTAGAESRVAATMSQPAAGTNRAVATITSASGQTITNAGLFTASTGGTLLIKGDFTGIALATNDAIQFTIDLEN